MLGCVRTVLLVVAIGCAPEPRPPVPGLPDGNYEPAPGADVWEASLTSSGNMVWWAYSKRTVEAETIYDHVYLSATSPDGEFRVNPTLVDATGHSWGPDIAVSGNHVMVAMHSGWDTPPRVRAFDLMGAPLATAPQAVDVRIAGKLPTVISSVALAPRADGRFTLVAGLVDESVDVAVVPLAPDFQAEPTIVQQACDRPRGT